MDLLKKLVIYPLVMGTLLVQGCNGKRDEIKQSLCEKLNIGYCDAWAKDYAGILIDFPIAFAKMDSLDKNLLIEAENFALEYGYDKVQFRKDLDSSCYNLVLKDLIAFDFKYMDYLINIARTCSKDKIKLQRETEIINKSYEMLTGFDCDIYNCDLINIGIKLAKDNELGGKVNDFNKFAKDKGITRLCEGDYELDVGRIK